MPLPANDYDPAPPETGPIPAPPSPPPDSPPAPAPVPEPQHSASCLQGADKQGLERALAADAPDVSAVATIPAQSAALSAALERLREIMADPRTHALIAPADAPDAAAMNNSANKMRSDSETCPRCHGHRWLLWSVEQPPGSGYFANTVRSCEVCNQGPSFAPPPPYVPPESDPDARPDTGLARLLRVLTAPLEAMAAALEEHRLAMQIQCCRSDVTTADALLAAHLYAAGLPTMTVHGCLEIAVQRAIEGRPLPWESRDTADPAQPLPVAPDPDADVPTIAAEPDWPAWARWYAANPGCRGSCLFSVRPRLVEPTASVRGGWYLNPFPDGPGKSVRIKRDCPTVWRQSLRRIVWPGGEG